MLAALFSQGPIPHQFGLQSMDSSSYCHYKGGGDHQRKEKRKTEAEEAEAVLIQAKLFVTLSLVFVVAVLPGYRAAQAH